MKQKVHRAIDRKPGGFVSTVGLNKQRWIFFPDQARQENAIKWCLLEQKAAVDLCTAVYRGHCHLNVHEEENL